MTTKTKAKRVAPEQTNLEKLNEILSADMSSMDAKGRTVVLQGAIDLVMQMTETGIKAQITADGPVMNTMDLRPQPEEPKSNIIT